MVLIVLTFTFSSNDDSSNVIVVNKIRRIQVLVRWGQLDTVKRLVAHAITDEFFWGRSVDCVAKFLLELACSPQFNLSAAFADL